MTFKDLQKIIQGTLVQQEQQTRLFSTLKGKEFWIWNSEQHRLEDIRTNGDCCFNHILGLPKKNGVEKPLFDYQKIIFDSLQFHKHIWIKKATGLGITEFFLRYIAWLCLRNNEYQGSQICIVTGPNIDIAIKLIKRLKGLFEARHQITFNSKETVLELNKCTIEAFPSNHLDSYRALDNPKFIFIDESDFFRKSEQEDVRHVSERYIAKSDPFIVMVSTPNAPDGLFEKIEREQEETCLYKRLKLDYTYGLDKIYTKEEIQKARHSPSFDREYDLKYLGLVGNAFHQLDIDNAVTDVYNPTDAWSVSTALGRSMGIDEGFGSSEFGIVITQGKDGTAEVIYAESFDRPLHNDMMDLVRKLKNKHHITKIFIDASNAGFISTLKYQLGDYDYRTYTAQKNIINHINDPRRDYNNVQVFPVNFATMHKDMLAHTNELLSAKKIKIHSTFQKLITSLRTAVVNTSTGSLDKDATSYNDIFDAFRMSLLNYKLVKPARL
jgi:hypothetical protein